MHLTDEQIQKYQLLHKKRFGVEISAEDAYRQGMDLVRFIAFLSGSTREGNLARDTKGSNKN